MSRTGVAFETSTRDPRDWRDRAVCTLLGDPELWFPIGESAEALHQAARAIAWCGTCPVRVECRDWALDRREDAGIWGGMTERERASFRRRGQRIETARRKGDA